MTLQDWIAALESEENPCPFGRSITRRIRQEVPDADIRKSRGDNRAIRDYVSHRLNVLWCDASFWKLLKKAPGVRKIQEYIEESHELYLPAFRHTVWREMVGDRASRQHLFRLLRARPGTFTKARLSKDAENALAEIKSRGAARLFDHYINRPGVSRCSLLRWFQLSDSTLGELQTFAKRLIKDISWCLKHKDAAKPEPYVSFGRGRRKSAKDVEELEDMVNLVRQHAFDTDDRNARRYMEERLNRDLNQAGDNGVKNYAVLAGVAKDLVEFREGQPVKRHVDAGKRRGLKPRRRGVREK